MKDMKVLSGTAVRPYGCSDDCDHTNFCSGGQDVTPVSTIRGTHGGLSSCSGNDTYLFTLKNDWTYDHYEWIDWATHGIQGGPQFSIRAPWGVTVNWFADVAAVGEYSLNVYITGPMGVPEH